MRPRPTLAAAVYVLALSTQWVSPMAQAQVPFAHACDPSWNFETQAPMADNTVAAASCWSASLVHDAAQDAGRVVLQLYLTGVNHPPGTQCSIRDLPMETSALANLTSAMDSDWPGSARVLALTGVRNTAFTIPVIGTCFGDRGGCGAFDDCLVKYTKARQLALTSVHPNVWTSHKSEREFAVLTPIATAGRWRTVSTQMHALHTIDNSGYERGLFHVVLESVCGPHVRFSLFLTHLSVNDDAANLEEIKTAYEIIKQTVGNDEYAPILAGDFNGQPMRVPTLSAGFDELNFPTSGHCSDGSFPNTDVGIDGALKILVGRSGCQSDFWRARGHFSVVRQTVGPESGPAGITPGGRTVGAIVHVLVGAAFTAIADSGPQPCGKCGGITTCDGQCSQSTPTDFHQTCNACGGTIQCDGFCEPACSKPGDCDGCCEACSLCGAKTSNPGPCSRCSSCRHKCGC
jgi:hypothetical protein